MRKKVTEPERLDKYLVNYGDNNDDFKALVLKLLAEFQDVEKIHQLTNVPISTIYLWLEEWNKKKKVL
jgi:transposase